MQQTKPLITIVSPYYQGTVTDAEFMRMLNSLKDQLTDEVEWLIYHDGPLLTHLPLPEEEIPARIIETAERANLWGHNLRQLGIFEAQGEYILHANIDNCFYPDFLPKLIAYIKENPVEAYLCPIRMCGLVVIRTQTAFNFGKPGPDSYILVPYPQMNSIDVMQLIMRRDVWLRYGGWYDRSMNSDGIMYPKILSEIPFIMFNEVMGEHW